MGHAPGGSPRHQQLRQSNRLPLPSLLGCAPYRQSASESRYEPCTSPPLRCRGKATCQAVVFPVLARVLRCWISCGICYSLNKVLLTNRNLIRKDPYLTPPSPDRRCPSRSTRKHGTDG